MEFERHVENKRAIAMTMVAQQRLHRLLMEEIEEAVLHKFRELFDDAFVDNNYKLFNELGKRQSYWGLRRPGWPANCSVAISADKNGYSDIFFGIRAPDGKNRSVEKVEACKDFRVIKEAAKSIEGGASGYYWPWWKSAEPNDWPPEMLASLVLESPTGKIADHPLIKDLIDRMIALTEAVDEAVST